MSEICLNVKPFMQPHPFKNPGGDCFACVLTATLQHLFSENQPEFERVWDYFLQNYKDSDEKALSTSWLGMESAFIKTRADNYKIDYTYDIVLPYYDYKNWSHAFYNQKPSDIDYSRRLSGWLLNDWIAITEINFNGDGPYTSDGRYNGTDHFVLFDGVKEVIEYDDIDDDCGTLRTYIHVVCSVKGGYWIRTNDLIRKHGAAGWWLVRKRNGV